MAVVRLVWPAVAVAAAKVVGQLENLWAVRSWAAAPEEPQWGVLPSAAQTLEPTLESFAVQISESLAVRLQALALVEVVLVVVAAALRAVFGQRPSLC